jgi:predicted DCC family thiol-disulfide oxidoreductase YuxK
MTSTRVIAALELGRDANQQPRSLFLYDGGCGVCKFTVALVAHYDWADHIRYRPLQTTDDPQMRELYQELGIPPFDLSTAVYMESTNHRIYTKSEAIFYLFPHMGFPFTILGPLLLLLFPKFLRDWGYTKFAQHRGDIWILIKRITGLGDTSLVSYRDRILLPPGYSASHPLPSSWGLDAPSPPVADEVENKKES